MSLPGDVLSLPSGSKCEDHPEVPAVVKIQGETDSFGFESICMCTECYTAYKEAISNPAEEGCDYCHTLAVLSPYRDPDEGSHGPVYDICDTCRQKSNRYHHDN